MAKFEKTDAYVCSGTARARPLASALHYFFWDRVEIFSNARSGTEGAYESRRDQGQGREGERIIKEETGEALNDPELEAEGRAERNAGELREGFGKAKRKVGEAVDDIVDEVDE